MPMHADTECLIRTTLHKYCDTFDRARFDEFAALFTDGRWFMVSQPGSRAVRDWIDRHVILYDGSPLTRHEMSNVIVEDGPTGGEAAFRCYVAIWQHLEGAGPILLAHARFRGMFRKIGEHWRWVDHVMEPGWTGQLETHIDPRIAAIDQTVPRQDW